MAIGGFILQKISGEPKSGDQVMGKGRQMQNKTSGDNGWPELYYAVIFTAQRSLSGDDIYDISADRMVALAQQQRGFLGVESVRGDDGIGITVSYWTDRDAIAGWRQHAEHLAAQALGRQEFYDWYRVRIAEVVREHAFISDQVVGSGETI